MRDVPDLRMNNGNEIPQIGLGLRLIDVQDLPAVLGQAVAMGYRLIDTAQTYGNEQGIGTAIRRGTVNRDDLFITTKIANRNQGRSRTLSSFDESLQRLGTEVVDLCLVHWPQPMYDQYVETWRTLVELGNEGRTRAVGVSNFTVACLERIIDETGVVPAVNQVELHPQLPQSDLLRCHAELGILVQAWAPFGHGQVLANPVVRQIASEKAKSPAQVVLRWHLQRGTIVLPKSAALGHMKENLDVWDFELTAQDTARLAQIPTRRLGPDPESMADR
ncbi:MAG TPA: aldo/keto reductase [Acidimicrobiales bacterium]|nr:aldo/keto reductase [Acidimicrobiales bacterium]